MEPGAGGGAGPATPAGAERLGSGGGIWRFCGGGTNTHLSAGVVMFTKSAAQELGPHAIRVNAVAPGLIEVREDQVSQEYKKRFLTMIPRGRTGRASDIAGTVAFLLSREADFINGECIVVDGGFLTGRPLMRSAST